MCHVLYRFTTGDACGTNMITRNAYALNQEFVSARFRTETGIKPVRVFLEANMGGDKKPSHAFFQCPGHGKEVVAAITVPERFLQRVLHVGSKDIVELELAGLHGAHASGMQSSAFTPASVVAAIFAAAGQDLGMVATSSMAHVTATDGPAGLHLSIRFSGLEVGTVGGGTTLPHAQSYLQLMGCLGPGKVYRLAQIVAATALCLELSGAASMASPGSENFLRAHLERGGVR
jgi:hydroxymethylglutaryl-CoA reductase (NADPH)